jgi:NAD(P)H-flavin reductase
MPSVTVQQIESLNYNVRRFRVEKPEGYSFIPGQAVQQSDAVEQLIFSNKTAKDLFLEKELRAATDDKLLLTYTQEHVDGVEHGRVNATFLRKHLKSVDQFFYICGPPGMVESVETLLKQHGAQPEKSSPKNPEN